jgi:hypothetical protein
MHVLLDDELGRLTVRRLRPWHRWLARSLAARLDRQLADGARPEASAILAARAMFLTSVEFRRDLAASLRRILAAAASPPASPATRPRLAGGPSATFAREPFLPLRRDRIARSAPELAGLAGFLAQQGPVPAQGVAMVSQLLSDGGGPLYRVGSRDDLDAIIERASQALIR